MRAVTHLEKVITGEVSAVTHLEKVIAGETSAVTYTEKVITGEAPPITHLQKVIAGEASPVTHLEYVWTGGTPSPTEHEYTGAVPYTFTADGSPLISWRISGNTTQSGTPTPDSPITPQGCGERTENLFDKDKQAGNIYVTETATRYGVEIPVEAGVYTIVGGTNRMFVKEKYGTTYGTALDTSAQRIITLPQNGYILIYAARAEDYTVSNIMLNTGSTAFPYEPYGYKILISSANTTTPVYLGEVQTTRKIKKVVFDGTESWQAGTENFYRIIDSFGEGIPYSSVICTHAQHSTINNNGKALVIKISDFSPISSVTDFKAYLSAQYAAGTPVTVWYVLAEPETGIVNEPLMKIGDYADTISMEQAGVQIPTLNGQTVIDVDTTLKPSEVYIKYQG
jgi:hypothetical protein